MTKHTSIFPIFLMLVLLLSCNENVDEEITENSPSVIIAGAFYNFQSVDALPNIGLYAQDYITKNITNTEKELDTLGRFKFEFEITEQPGVMLIHNTIIDLIVKPGDSLFVEIDATAIRRKDVFEHLNVSGTSAEINKNVIDFFYNDPIDYEIFQNNRRHLSPTKFKSYRDSIYLVQSRYSDSLLTNTTFSKLFTNWLEAQKLFALPNNYSLFEFYFKDENDLKSELNKDDSISATKFNIHNIPQVLKKHRINRIASNSIPKKLIDHTLITSQRGASNLNPTDTYSYYLEKIIEIYSDKPELLKLMVNDFIKSNLNIENIEIYEDHRTLIDSILFKTDFESSLKEKYVSLKMRINTPQLTDKINLKTYASSNIDSLIQKMISESNGKPIYIDNWATWCTPCLSEFKESTPKLIRQFEDEIEFVFLCYKSEKRQWKSTISKYQLKGKHYFIEKNQIEDLTNIFSINGFPTYTIINQEGEIINTGNDYRPSNTKTVQLLESLLKK
ncbi:TlpA family protein disulfide reductase [Winogradskyella psychrotolerans]|uniref:TlpA family protein disulfide reductase n=1 Tax=Winogradskyella psychrotolerans TaxID=1344585 RepID=UPI001C06E190|nr:thioredoxin-like domain-containing protein [Winogradskyella psychrotolerans]MBU2928844.1 hypothetical protein [Winogradskyella psychrotolerans]